MISGFRHEVGENWVFSGLLHSSQFFLFQYMYRTTFITLYYDRQIHNYFTNYHTPTCFDTIVSSSGNL
jgi:hypothetical protein